MKKSPLLNAVKRHTRIAAISHPLPAPVSPETAHGLDITTSDNPVENSPVVKASWVSLPRQPEMSVTEEPASPSDQMSLQNEFYMKSQPIESFPSASVQESGTPKNSASLAAPVTQGEDVEDNLWRRLQTIFNRHQEKELNEKENPTETPPAQELLSNSVHPESLNTTYELDQRPDRKSDTIEQPTSTSKSIQEKEEHPYQIPPTEAHRPEEKAEVQGRKKAKEDSLKPDTSQVVLSAEGKSTIADDKALSRTTEHPDSSQSVPRKTVTQDELLTTQSAGSISLLEEKTTPKEPVHQIYELHVSEITRQHPKAESSETGNTQPIPETQTYLMKPEHQESSSLQEETHIEFQASPLQDVWPVQERETKPAINDSNPEPIVKAPNKLNEETSKISQNLETSLPVVHAEFNELDHIQQRLDRVRTVPSDSSVEFIPPRRPRPKSLMGQSGATVQRKPSSDDIPGFPINPINDESQTEKSKFPQTSRSVTSNTQGEQSQKDSITPAPQLTSSRQTEHRSGTSTVGPSAYATEIGELPADLWQLIGEEPPAHSESISVKEPPVSQNFSSTSKQMSVHVMRAEENGFSSHTCSTTATPGVLQRQAETEQAPQAPEQTREDQEGLNQEQGAAQEIDIQELAKKVYSEIKSKLALEWERSRF